MFHLIVVRTLRRNISPHNPQEALCFTPYIAGRPIRVRNLNYERSCREDAAAAYHKCLFPSRCLAGAAQYHHEFVICPALSYARQHADDNVNLRIGFCLLVC